MSITSQFATIDLAECFTCYKQFRTHFCLLKTLNKNFSWTGQPDVTDIKYNIQYKTKTLDEISVFALRVAQIVTHYGVVSKMVRHKIFF